jgi:hypothetical protein
MTATALADTAWCVIDGTVVMLDIVRDRYFRLPEQRNQRFLADIGQPLPEAPVQPRSFPMPPGWLAPATRRDAFDDAPFRLGDVARSLWTQRRAEQRLAARPLHTVLADLRDVWTGLGRADAFLSPQAMREVQAFERARLLRSAAGRCLPRSIALALCLARRRCRAHLVLGVKLAPFAAHSWVQVQDAVLGDELEEVLRYTPILVV